MSQNKNDRATASLQSATLHVRDLVAVYAYISSIMPKPMYIMIDLCNIFSNWLSSGLVRWCVISVLCLSCSCGMRTRRSTVYYR